MHSKIRHFPSKPSKYQKSIVGNALSGLYLKNIQILDHSLHFGEVFIRSKNEKIVHIYNGNPFPISIELKRDEHKNNPDL